MPNSKPTRPWREAGAGAHRDHDAQPAVGRTSERIGIVMGVPSLIDLFDEKKPRATARRDPGELRAAVQERPEAVRLPRAALVNAEINLDYQPRPRRRLGRASPGPASPGRPGASPVARRAPAVPGGLAVGLQVPGHGGRRRAARVVSWKIAMEWCGDAGVILPVAPSVMGRIWSR